MLRLRGRLTAPSVPSRHDRCSLQQLYYPIHGQLVSSAAPRKAAMHLSTAWACSTPPGRPSTSCASTVSRESHGSSHCVYVLKSLVPGSRATYCGVTLLNRLSPRLLQHNGESKGGAKATRANRPWGYAITMHGFPSRTVALQCEWRLKHWDGRRTPSRRPEFSGPEGRIRALNHIICNSDTWTTRGALISESKLYICIDPGEWPLMDEECITARHGEGCVTILAMSCLKGLNELYRTIDS